VTTNPPITKVAICTPAYDGRVHVGYWRGCDDVKRTLSVNGCEVLHCEAGHSANLPRLRNALTAQALDWGADAILWIDSDVQPSGKDALRLVDAVNGGVSIVGASIQKRPHTYNEKPVVAFKEAPDGLLHYDGKLVRVGAVPTAFCMVHRRVYEALSAPRKRFGGLLTKPPMARKLMNRDCKPASPWFRNFYWYELLPDANDPNAFHDDGEDYYFSRKALELGFWSYIHPQVRPIHHGSNVRLPVNFWDLYGGHFEGKGDENAR